MTKPALGGRDLGALLKSMSPRLHPETFVFAMLPKGAGAELASLAPNAVMVFQEAEGTTLIVPQSCVTGRDIPHAFPCRMITLEVHSALDAVGFIAAVAAALSESGISTNPVSGFYHDHLFVPANDADAAVAILQTLSEQTV